MKRTICLLATALMSLSTIAQRTTDFAERFMQSCHDDSLVECVTVSPKMMEQIAQPDSTRSHNMQLALQKLKSARIITASDSLQLYYQRAEQLLKRYPKRFIHNRDYGNALTYGSFYTRKIRSGKTVELIMLRADVENNQLVIVNLTGDIDEEFVNALAAPFENDSE